MERESIKTTLLQVIISIIAGVISGYVTVSVNIENYNSEIKALKAEVVSLRQEINSITLTSGGNVISNSVISGSGRDGVHYGSDDAPSTSTKVTP